MDLKEAPDSAPATAAEVDLVGRWFTEQEANKFRDVTFRMKLYEASAIVKLVSEAMRQPDIPPSTWEVGRVFISFCRDIFDEARLPASAEMCALDLARAKRH